MKEANPTTSMTPNPTRCPSGLYQQCTNPQDHGHSTPQGVYVYLYFQSFQLQALQMGFAYMCIKIGNLFNISITINTCYCNPFLDLKVKIMYGPMNGTNIMGKYTRNVINISLR